MSDWGNKVGKREEDQPLGKQLAEIMALSVNNSETRNNVGKYYDDCRWFSKTMAGYNPQERLDDLADEVVDDLLEKDAEDSETYVDPINSEDKNEIKDGLRNFAEVTLPDPDNILSKRAEPINYQNIIDLAVFNYRHQAGVKGKVLDKAEEEIEHLEKEDPIGLSAASMRDEHGLANHRLEIAEEEGIARNLGYLKNAVTTLIRQDASLEEIEEENKHTERVRALKIFSQAPQIIESALDKLSQGKELESPKGAKRREGLHDALAELQAALEPAIARAQGELRLEP